MMTVVKALLVVVGIGVLAPCAGLAQTRNAEACSFNPAPADCIAKVPNAISTATPPAPKPVAPVKRTVTPAAKRLPTSAKACPNDEFECIINGRPIYGIRAMTRQPGARNCVMVNKRAC